MSLPSTHLAPTSSSAQALEDIRKRRKELAESTKGKAHELEVLLLHQAAAEELMGQREARLKELEALEDAIAATADQIAAVQAYLTDMESRVEAVAGIRCVSWL